MEPIIATVNDFYLHLKASHPIVINDYEAIF